MQRHGQFHATEARPEMAAASCHRVDQEGTQLRSQLRQGLLVEAPEVCGDLDLIQQRIR